MKKTTMGRIVLSPLVLLFFLVFLQGCTTLDGRKGTIKIGLVAPFSGADSLLGYDALFAAKLAINEKNAAGGIGGYSIALVAHDDLNNAEWGDTAAHKLVVDPDVMGAIGHPGNESALAAVERYHNGNLAFISNGATSDELNVKAYDEIFRVVANDKTLSKEMVAFAAKQKGVRGVAIVAEPITGSVKLADRVYTAFPESLSLVFGEPFRQEQTDFANVARRLRNSSPDMVIYSGAASYGGTFWAEVRNQGTKASLLMSPASANPNFFKIARDAGKGVYLVTLGPFPAGVPEASAMVEGYKALSGVDPLSLAGLTYDATNLMLDAIQRAYVSEGRIERTGVARALRNSDFNGISGKIAFDIMGERQNPQVYIYQYEGQDFPGRKVN